MKTSTKLMIWAASILGVMGVASLAQYMNSRPSPVVEAVVVEVSGCDAIDLNFCKTTVDIGGVRLNRSGDWGSVGDTMLIVQVNYSTWRAPMAGEIRKYREQRVLPQARP